MTAGTAQHTPVLVREVVSALALKPDGCYVDCTFGQGGHSAAILAALGSHGRVYAIDRDPEAAKAAGRFRSESRFTFASARISELGERLRGWGIAGQVDGILFDLGVSSAQLADRTRGFSFMHEGPLDMRMDPARGVSAAAWLARAGEADIARCLYEYGEERDARRIARAIVRERERSPIDTTQGLVAAVAKARRGAPRQIHFATRTFQALRIQVNDELNELRAALPQAVDALRPSGRLVVLSFHSLEDRITKRFIRDESRATDAGPGLARAGRPRLRAIGKALRPDLEERRSNRRARSAVLRAAERIA
jgi:16S rRNA (cytosine1402-N4)-methyltransferase